MSKLHARKFVDHADRDKALYNEIRTATNHVLKIAKKHGYKVSRKELSAELAKRWEAEKAKKGKGARPDTCSCFL